MVRILFVIMFIAASCSSSDKVQIRDLSKDFPTTIELKGEVMNIPSDSLDDCLSFDIVGNYGIISGQSSEKLLTIFNLYDGTINKQVYKGRGPGEFQYPFVLVSDSSYYLMMVSPTEDYYTTTDYINFYDSGIILQYERGSFVLKDSLITIPTMLLSSSRLIYNPYNVKEHYNNSMRFSVYNKNGEFTDSIGSFLGIRECYDSAVSFKLANLSARGFCSKLCGSDFFVYAPSRGTYLEFYDCTDTLNTSMRRIVYAIPRMNIEEITGGFIGVTAPDCLVGFTDITSSDKNYYCLYLGITHEKLVERKYNESSQNVYLFSAKGEPLHHYKLDRDVKNIAVTPNGEYLYAWSPNEETLEPQIVRYALP